MELYLVKEMCCGCGACAEVCPQKAIKMVRDKEGFDYPQINGDICAECEACRYVCPMKGHEPIKSERFYAGAQAKEDKLRYSGSSGGVFSVLAQYVLRYQGVVYGAGYDECMTVVHREAQNDEQLEKIKRTKYVQSNMEGIYGKVERKLKEGRWVLFCGTPCQADALRLFLRDDYEKLILIDLVCYGVPSPGIWENYVKYLEHIHGGKMTDFSFRDKRKMNNGHTCSYIIDGKEYTDSLYRDIFCKMYFQNYILRPSCHNCRFCTVNRKSDFTIGDFWGIEHIRPHMDDGMGTSMVIIHSERAGKIWNQIKTELNWFACTKEHVLQPRLLKPAEPARGRKRFMKMYERIPFEIIVKLLKMQLIR